MTQGRIGESLMQHYIDTQMSNGDCCSHPKQERNNLNWYAPTSKVATKEKIGSRYSDGVCCDAVGIIDLKVADYRRYPA